MKTLSIRQPWASLICAGVKDVENRTWAPSEAYIGQKILIHAGGTKVPKNFLNTIPFEWVSAIQNATRYGWIPRNEVMPTGAIIGYATLAGFRKETDSLWDGGEGQIKWLFKDPYLFDKPIPAKGALGLFDFALDEDDLPPAHIVKTILPHIEGNQAVFPSEDELLDELGEMDGPIYDVTLENVNEFFDLEASEDEYIPREIETIKLVSRKRELVLPVECVEAFPQTWDDTGTPIFYTSLRGEEFVKLLMCFVLKQ